MILVNNGFNKFHLAPAASELASRGLLSAFFTGAYPTVGVRKWLRACGLESNSKVARLLRRGEPIPEELIHSDVAAEALHVVGRWLRRWRATRVAGVWADRQSLCWYGDRAQGAIRYAAESGARLYHYRAGFGQASVSLAKRQGLFTLCDHSIAHPTVLEGLVSNGGKWAVGAGTMRPRSRLWRNIQEDIEQADAVLVNSDFVKETFLWQGWESARVHVIYWGVDDAFFRAVPTVPKDGSGEGAGLRIVFAGEFEVRKGAKVLAAAMKLLADQRGDFELHMAGDVAPEAVEMWASVQRDVQVHHHGLLSRRDLATLLTSADVFVFPSLAEGSARVVFEALACGCYVITTPNSGSIVEDRIHGRLIPPGEPEPLADAVREAIACGREALRQVGVRNSTVVRGQYRQSQYGDKLVALYSRLIDDRRLSTRSQNSVGSHPGSDVSSIPTVRRSYLTRNELQPINAYT